MRIALHAFVMCALVAPVAADPAAAERARSDAEALAAKQDFVAAALKFREAYAEDPRPELICNVGIAYYKAKDFPHAYRYLGQCLDAGRSLDAAFLDSVTKAQAAVTARLAAGDFTPVDLVVEPPTATATFDSEEPIVGSRRIWVAYGSHHVTIHAESFTDQDQTIHAQAHDPVVLRVVLDRPVPEPAGSGSNAPAGSGSEGSAAGSGSAAPIERPQPVIVPRPVATHSHTAAWISTGVTALAAVTALVTYGIAHSRASDAATAPDPARYFDDIDSARNFQRASWIAGAAAGTAALVTGFLWWRSTRPIAVVPEAHGGAVVLTLGW